MKKNTKNTRKTKKKEYGDEAGAELRKRINEYADSMDDDKMLVADGFDAAIIGVTDECEPKVVYDWQECVNILMLRDGMTEEDALEHMSFNVTGAYVGERTPIFVRPI